MKKPLVKSPPPDWPKDSPEFLLTLIGRSHGHFARLPYRVLVRDEYLHPMSGCASHHPDLKDWLNERTSRVIEKTRKSGKVVRMWESTGFDWAHWNGCYAMNDATIAVEFKLRFG